MKALFLFVCDRIDEMSNDLFLAIVAGLFLVLILTERWRMQRPRIDIVPPVRMPPGTLPKASSTLGAFAPSKGLQVEIKSLVYLEESVIVTSR